MILSKPEILEARQNGDIIADGVLPKQIAEHSIDVSLNKNIWVHSNFFDNSLNSEIKKQKDGYGGYWYLLDISKPKAFLPGMFCLPIVDEFVGTRAGSGLCCEFKLKSTSARHGIDHSLAGFIEEGYFNRLCLEFSFHRPVTLKAGDLIGQFIFHKLTSPGQNYADKKSYQKTSSLEELKANWKPEMVLPKSIKNKLKLT